MDNHPLDAEGAVLAAGGSAAIGEALQQGAWLMDVAEALDKTLVEPLAYEAVVLVAEAQNPFPLMSVAEAVEEAGGAFAIAEHLASAHPEVAEAIEQVGGAFAVAEALSMPSRLLVHKVAKGSQG